MVLTLLMLMCVFTLHETSACWFLDGRRGCVLDVNRDLAPQNAPLLLRRGSYNYELAGPDDVINVKTLFTSQHRSGVLRIPRGDEIYAACPGYGNTLHGFKEAAQFAALSCFLPRTLLRLDRQVVTSRRLRCTQLLPVEVRDSGTPCGSGQARLFHIGYSVTSESNPSVLKQHSWRLFRRLDSTKKVLHEGKSSFLRVFSSCYDPSKVHTLYSLNVLEGSKIAGAETKQMKTAAFTKGQASLYPEGFDVNGAYDMKQQKVLGRTVGKSTADSLLQDNNMTRALLVPAEDLLMGTWQTTAYTYVNVVPQWWTINQGNWFSLEQMIRKLAGTSQSTLIVTTGTQGVLEVRDEANHTRELYLEPSRKLLPVPALLWKLVYSPKNRSCIAFVMSNNPLSPPRPICQDVCGPNGWPQDYTSPRLGFMYCCTAQDLWAAVPHAPQYPCLDVLDNIRDPTDNSVSTNFWVRLKHKFT